MRNKIAYTIVRVLLGLLFLFSGVTKFFPLPSPELPQPAMDFFAGLVATGYMIPLIGIVEIIVGLFLLANFWVPFAMVLLSPIMFNVVLLNLLLIPSVMGLTITFALLALQVYVMYYSWKSYVPLFVRVK